MTVLDVAILITISRQAQVDRNLWERSFNRKADLITGVQLGLMIRCDDTQQQHVRARFNPIQSSLFALEHAHQFIVHISVDVMSRFPLDQLELEGNLVAFERLSRGR